MIQTELGLCGETESHGHGTWGSFASCNTHKVTAFFVAWGPRYIHLHFTTLTSVAQSMTRCVLSRGPCIC